MFSGLLATVGLNYLLCVAVEKISVRGHNITPKQQTVAGQDSGRTGKDDSTNEAAKPTGQKSFDLDDLGFWDVVKFIAVILSAGGYIGCLSPLLLATDNVFELAMWSTAFVISVAVGLAIPAAVAAYVHRWVVKRAERKQAGEKAPGKEQ